MEESTIFKLALLSSLVGIFIILLVAENLEVKLYNISSITNDNLDEKVKVNGEIISIRETPGLIIMDLKDETGVIKVILFKEGEVNINRNDKVEIIGKVIKYRNYLEIETESIKII
ncbi:exodeoxyribonuclease VII large subunit [Candidatus Woesearchaeota archaeon]|nr:exodeoxyribonuclease VII large subunit [Candidatus Woesearchaeota archaeon]